MSAEKRTISAPAELLAKADLRAESLGYSNFSQYVQALMRADVIQSAAHVRDVAPGGGGPSGPNEPSSKVYGLAVSTQPSALSLSRKETQERVRKRKAAGPTSGKHAPGPGAQAG